MKRMLRTPNVEYTDKWQSGTDGVFAIWRPSVPTLDEWVRVFRRHGDNLSTSLDNSGEYSSSQVNVENDHQALNAKTVSKNKLTVLAKGHGFEPRVLGGYDCQSKEGMAMAADDSDDSVLPPFGESDQDQYDIDSEWEADVREDQRAEARIQKQGAQTSVPELALSPTIASPEPDVLLQVEAEELRQGEHDLEDFARSGQRRATSGAQILRHQSVGRHLTPEQVEDIIHQEWAKFEELWRTETLPKLERKAGYLYIASRTKLTFWRTDLDRLLNVRKPKMIEFIQSEFSSANQVRKACKNMSTTISQICSFQWKINLAEGEQPPAHARKMSGVKGRNVAKKSAPNSDDDEDLGSFIASEDENEKDPSAIEEIRPYHGPLFRDMNEDENEKDPSAAEGIRSYHGPLFRDMDDLESDHSITMQLDDDSASGAESVPNGAGLNLHTPVVKSGPVLKDRVLPLATGRNITLKSGMETGDIGSRNPPGVLLEQISLLSSDDEENASALQTPKPTATPIRSQVSREASLKSRTPKDTTPSPAGRTPLRLSRSVRVPGISVDIPRRIIVHSVSPPTNKNPIAKSASPSSRKSPIVNSASPSSRKSHIANSAGPSGSEKDIHQLGGLSQQRKVRRTAPKWNRKLNQLVLDFANEPIANIMIYFRYWKNNVLNGETSKPDKLQAQLFREYVRSLADKLDTNFDCDTPIPELLTKNRSELEVIANLDDFIQSRLELIPESHAEDAQERSRARKGKRRAASSDESSSTAEPRKRNRRRDRIESESSQEADADSLSDSLASSALRQTRRRNINRIQPENEVTKRIHEGREAQETAIQERLAQSGKGSPTSNMKVVVNLGHPDDEKDVCIPEWIVGRLKEHQIEGIRFLWKNIIMLKQPSADGQSSVHGGCILAHAMGLGKTLQTIVFVYILMREIQEENPAVPKHLSDGRVLVVVPASVVSNWEHEFHLWMKDHLDVLRRVYCILGNEKTGQSRFNQIRAWHRRGGILIVGYSMLQSIMQTSARSEQELEQMRNNARETGGDPDRILSTSSKAEVVGQYLLQGTSLLVCDEGHLIKNVKSHRSKLMNQFQTPSRICLTGCPLQNNLSEYWCMIDFVVPRYLGTIGEFRNQFENPIVNGMHCDSTEMDQRIMRIRMSTLISLIQPLVMRRGEEILTAALPKKTEFIIICKPSQLQFEAYVAYLSQLESTGSMSSNIIACMQSLLLLCGHPGVFKQVVDEKFQANTAATQSKQKASMVGDIEAEMEEALPLEDAELLSFVYPTFDHVFRPITDYMRPEHSNKILVALQIVHSALRSNQKVLFFSRKLPILRYFKKILEGRGIQPFMLTGATPVHSRQQLIGDFNDPSLASVFMLSTTAGCVGINLQGATHVILFDLGWNPSDAEQAVARAYRYGQESPTFIYRLQVCNTFDEALFKNNVHKVLLANNVVDDKNMKKMFTKEEMRKYLIPPPPPSEIHWQTSPEEEVQLRNLGDTALNDVLDNCHDHLVSVSERTNYLIEMADEMNEEERAESRRHVDEEIQWRKDGRKAKRTTSHLGANITPLEGSDNQPTYLSSAQAAVRATFSANRTHGAAPNGQHNASSFQSTPSLSSFFSQALASIQGPLSAENTHPAHLAFELPDDIRIPGDPTSPILISSSPIPAADTTQNAPITGNSHDVGTPASAGPLPMSSTGQSSQPAQSKPAVDRHMEVGPARESVQPIVVTESDVDGLIDALNRSNPSNAEDVASTVVSYATNVTQNGSDSPAQATHTAPLAQGSQYNHQNHYTKNVRHPLRPTSSAQSASRRAQHGPPRVVTASSTDQRYHPYQANGPAFHSYRLHGHSFHPYNHASNGRSNSHSDRGQYPQPNWHQTAYSSQQHLQSEYQPTWNQQHFPPNTHPQPHHEQRPGQDASHRSFPGPR
ncbi:SNF2 family N-terminal domain-containing protein [Phlyctochytrium arcticum]|nr:SNF2 family N-terminal domain-containing protein [Phlyctochytrium arcticum]